MYDIMYASHKDQQTDQNQHVNTALCMQKQAYAASRGSPVIMAGAQGSWKRCCPISSGVSM